MTVERDDSQFPFVVIRPIGKTRNEDVAENLRFLDRCFAREAPFSVLFDIRRGSSLSSTQRRMYIEFFAANEARIAKHFLGGVTVSGSPLVRGAVRAMFWAYPPRFATLVTDDLSQGEAWIRAKLARAA